MNTRVVAISVDSVPSLKAWSDSLGGIDFPLLSDFWPHGELAERYGVLRSEGMSERAIFLLDPRGVVRYVDVHDIADQPSNEVLFEQIAKLEPEAAAAWIKEQTEEFERITAAGDIAASSGAAAAAASAEQAAGIVMYCRTWCPDCMRARSWLDERGISYVEIDVDSDEMARQRAASLNDGRLHTPTFEIGDEICVDFKPDRLHELIGG